jgi:hypothetical protein
MFSNIQAWPWSMFAAIFGGLSLITLWWINVIRPRRRRRALRSAAKTFFLVPKARQHECKYAIQDDEEHVLKDISLWPNGETTVDMVIYIKETFSFTEIGIGFLGDPDRKPYFTKYFNRYVEIGRGREVDPARETDDDFVDKHFYYHRRVNRTVTAGMVLSIAFTIKTRDVGFFPMHIYFLSDEPIGEGFDCFVTVEGAESLRQCCQEASHKSFRCRLVGTSQFANSLIPTEGA